MPPRCALVLLAFSLALQARISPCRRLMQDAPSGDTPSGDTAAAGAAEPPAQQWTGPSASQRYIQAVPVPPEGRGTPQNRNITIYLHPVQQSGGMNDCDATCAAHADPASGRAMVKVAAGPGGDRALCYPEDGLQDPDAVDFNGGPGKPGCRRGAPPRGRLPGRDAAE